MSRVATSHDVVALVAPRLRDADVEHFVALALDAKNRPLALIDVAKGSITACPVAPADVFRAVLREAAPAVVFAHNHPSGDPQPSPEDVALTDRLVSAGRLLGIHVVDHVIIAREGHFSFLDAGLLARRPPRGVSA
jgi:DNA repair protein RadC